MLSSCFVLKKIGKMYDAKPEAAGKQHDLNEVVQKTTENMAL